MPLFKDLFISYGRRESLGFVGRLHQKLRLIGFDAWFDKVNIPDGDDYAARINHGIETAHNFVYVMAPRCMTSPYCLIELEYARILGKRVIPLNQQVVFQTEAQPIAPADREVLKQFYAAFEMPDPDLKDTQDVLNRSLNLIGKTDWLDAKENLDTEDCAKMAAWAQSYENQWHRHDDLEYLKIAEFPRFGESVDPLPGVVVRIKLVLERHREYVEDHTLLLNQALAWQCNQKKADYLLSDHAREQAQAWLRTEFTAGDQPPCTPNPLLCEFISESRKHAENFRTDAFICYEKKDLVVRNQVITALARYGVTTWRHDADIRKGVEYATAIEQGIADADNLLYFISPYSVVSEYCQRELDYALALNKRIIPLLITDTTPTDIPEEVRGLQYIDCTQGLQFDPLLNILTQDQDYHSRHKALLTRARQWEQENRKKSLLLRGRQLDNAQTWLRLNRKRAQHRPLPIQQELIEASVSAAGELHTDVFVACSLHDSDFGRRLNQRLQDAGKITWFTLSDTVPGDEDDEQNLIEADNFIVVLSAEALQDENVLRHLLSATDKHGKRLISAQCREVPAAKLPAALLDNPRLDFIGKPFEQAFAEVVQILELDQAHTRQHTILQQRAREWSVQDKSEDFLLNSSAHRTATIWLERAREENKKPRPTPLQQEYIERSRGAIEAAARKQRRTIALLRGLLAWIVLGLVGAVGISIYAYKKGIQAEQKSILALEGETKALTAMSNAQYTLGEHFDALLSSLQAATRLRQIPAPDAALEAQVLSVLHQGIYSVREKNTIDVHDALHVELTEDGQGIVVYMADGRIVMWDYHGREIAEFEVDAKLEVETFLCGNPDSKTCLAYALDKSLWLWRWDVRQHVKLTDPEGITAESAQLHTNPSLVTARTEDGRMLGWSLGGERLFELQDEGAALSAIELSRNSEILLTYNPDQTRIRTWRNDATPIYTWDNADGYRNIALHPDGNLVLTLDARHGVRLWQNDGEQRMRLELDGAEHAAFSADGNAIVTLARERRDFSLWSLAGKRLAHFADPMEQSFHEWIDSPDGSVVALFNEDYQTYLWRTDGERLGTIERAYRRAFTPQGRFFITQTTREESNTYVLWDFDGKVHAKLSGHRGKIQALSSGDEQWFATASHDKTVRLWKDDGTALTVLLGHKDWVVNVQFDAQQQLISTHSLDGTVKIWQLYNPLSEKLIDVQSWVLPDKTDKRFMRALVTRTVGGTWKLWDDNGNQVRLLSKNMWENLALDYSPGRSWFVTYPGYNANEAADFDLWRIDDGAHIATLQEQVAAGELSINAVRGNTRLLAAVDGEGFYGPLRLWDTLDGKEITTVVARQPGEDGESITVHANEHSSVFVTVVAGENTFGPVQLWDADDGKLLQTLASRTEDRANDGAMQIHLSDHGKHLLSVRQTETSKGPVQLWDNHGVVLGTLKETEQIPGGGSVFWSVEMFSDETGVLLLQRAEYDNTNLAYTYSLELWDIVAIRRLAVLAHNVGNVPEVVYNNESRLIMTSRQDGPVQLWNLQGRLLATLFEDYQGETLGSDFSRDGALLAVTYRDGPVKLWSTDLGRATEVIAAGPEDSVAFSPDGKLLLTSIGKHTYDLWDLDGNKVGGPLRHDGSAFELMFHPDNRHIVTGGVDNTIKLWHLDGTWISTFKGHEAGVRNAYFSRNGRFLLSEDEKGVLISRRLEGVMVLPQAYTHACEWLAEYFATRETSGASTEIQKLTSACEEHIAQENKTQPEVD